MRKIQCLLFVVAIITQACAPTTQTPSISNDMAQDEAALQRELAVKENFKYVQRLENVAAPILMNNTELCGDLVAPYLGVELATKDGFSKEYQQTMADLYGVGAYPTVTLVAAKAPAAGKLDVGDMVTHVNGVALPQGKRSVAEFYKLIAASENQTVNLSVDRSGNAKNVSVKPVLACNSPVRLSISDSVNAFADGKQIGVTKGMMRFVESDAELATVIGHELAHNTRAHIPAKRGNAIIGGVLGVAVSIATGINVTGLGSQLGAGVNSQAFEAEADYVGLYHTARGGYAISHTPNLWRRIAASSPGAINLSGSTHPSTAKRFLALEATVKEINAKKAAGLPLLPEEKAAQNNTDSEQSSLND